MSWRVIVLMSLFTFSVMATAFITFFLKKVDLQTAIATEIQGHEIDIAKLKQELN